jgi:hypothetical protein
MSDEFWQWFVAHRVQFEALTSAEDGFWEEAEDRLQRVDERLWFELEVEPGGPRQFIVTVEGWEDAFPVADELVSRAPKLEGWKFVSLRPAEGFGFTLEHEGSPLDTRTLWCLPVIDEEDPASLGLTIGLPALTPAKQEWAENAVLIALDRGLGERAAAEEIQFLELAKLPAAPAKAGYFPLADLPVYLERRRSKRAKEGW